jgi:hypothetical protein
MFKKLTAMQKLTWQLMWEIINAHATGAPLVSDINFENIDQTYFTTLLQEHRLQLIAYPLLKHILPNHHPTLIQLHKKNLASTFRHLQQKKALVDIAKNFQKDHIAYVTLKGPALNDLLYGDSCLRQSRDLDVLITPEDALKAHHILRNLNYQVAHQQIEESILKNPKNFPHFVKDVNYLNHEQILLELHYRSNMIKEVGLQFSSHHETIKLAMMKQDINILPTEENFLYLCLHAAKHNWARLQWLIDLVLFVQKFPLNWDRTHELASHTHCIRPLLELKILLKEYFNLTLPSFPTSWQDKLAIHLHLRKVEAYWQLTINTQSRFLNKLRLLTTALLLYHRWLDKCRFIQSMRINSRNLRVKLKK